MWGCTSNECSYMLYISSFIIREMKHGSNQPCSAIVNVVGVLKNTLFWGIVYVEGQMGERENWDATSPYAALFPHDLNKLRCLLLWKLSFSVSCVNLRGSCCMRTTILDWIMVCCSKFTNKVENVDMENPEDSQS